MREITNIGVLVMNIKRERVALWATFFRISKSLAILKFLFNLQVIYMVQL